jgi:uncharacterized protein YuzE
MNKTKISYFEKQDILHVLVSSGREASSHELSPGVTAELDEKGNLIGIEITNATKYLRDTVLESVQARLSRIVPALQAG